MKQRDRLSELILKSGPSQDIEGIGTFFEAALLTNGLICKKQASMMGMGKLSGKFVIFATKTLYLFQTLFVLILKGCLFQPYMSLHNMTFLRKSKVSSFVVGASNVLFKQQMHCPWDVFVDVSKIIYRICEILKI